MRPEMKRMIGQLNPPGPDHIVVSRRDVAQAEIVQAIRLYFEGDFVSAHVLASAATEILHGLRKHAHKATSLADLEAKLREFMPDEADDAMAFLKLPYNFLKHSDGDADVKMHFRPAFVEVSVYHATLDYEAVFADRAPEMIAFQAWFMARHPDSFPNLPPEAKELLQAMDLATAPDDEAFAFGRDALARARK
jgi:hypothetical protein